MVKITKIVSRGIPVRGNDIDTDQIIPARYLRVITFAGIGKYAFQDVRFDDAGNEMDHPFNSPRFKGAQILVVNDNFGCGSSREHAPQSLKDYGIAAIIGESFAEIFAGNCTSIGIPTATLSIDVIQTVQSTIEAYPETELSLDIATATLKVGDQSYACTIKKAIQSALTTGIWDITGALLSNKDAIEKTVKHLPYLAFSKTNH